MLSWKELCCEAQAQKPGEITEIGKIDK